MNQFIEVTVSGYKILLNLERVIDVEEVDNGSCRINFQDDYLDPDEPYEIVRDMLNIDSKLSCDCISKVDDSPVVHGYWRNALGNYEVAECSNCQKWYEPCPDEKPSEDFYESFCEDYKYCPGCGAKMDLKETKDV